MIRRPHTGYNADELILKRNTQAFLSAYLYQAQLTNKHLASDFISYCLLNLGDRQKGKREE